MFLGESLLWAFLITGIVAGLSLVRTSKENAGPSITTASIISFLFNFLSIWAWLWWVQPVAVGTLWGHAWLLWPILVTGCIFLLADAIASGAVRDTFGSSSSGDMSFGLGGPLAIVVFFVLGTWWVFSYWEVRSQADATHLANLVEMTKAPREDYPPTDTNHIVMVPEQTAIFKASQVIASESDEKGRNLSTLYQPGEPTLQSVNDHLYWLSPLEFANWRSWESVGQVSPGFIAVDAENPNENVQLKLGYEMRYTPDAYFESNLDRMLFDKYRSYIIDGLSLEVDDDWKPYFTASLNKWTLHNGGEAPVKAIIVDPETFQIQEYDIGNPDLPAWVDRIYSASTAKRLTNWWGDFGDPNNAPWKFLGIGRGSKARFQVWGDPVLVYTTSGHPSWQMVITSRNNDDSTTGIVLFDGRDNKAIYYTIIEGTAIGSAVTNAFSAVSADVKLWDPEHLSMHKIYGRATWVVSYISKPEENINGQTFQAIGLVDAEHLTGANVVYAETKEQALALYRQKLAQSDDTGDPTTELEIKEVKGTIGGISTQVRNGNTVYLIWLNEDPTKVYSAPAERSVELGFAVKDDHVIIRFIDVAAASSQALDVRDFNDLALQMIE
ncbi:MAG: hypothetical protein AAB531_04030 [Patescibacteria group bacterium]